LVEHRDQEEVDKAAQTPKQGFQPERNFGVVKSLLKNYLIFLRKASKRKSSMIGKLKSKDISKVIQISSSYSLFLKELAPPTWAKKIIDSILLNMIITIKNVNIYYEVCYFFLFLKLRKLEYNIINKSKFSKIKLKRA